MPRAGIVVGTSEDSGAEKAKPRLVEAGAAPAEAGNVIRGCLTFPEPRCLVNGKTQFSRPAELRPAARSLLHGKMKGTAHVRGSDAVRHHGCTKDRAGSSVGHALASIWLRDDWRQRGAGAG